MTRVIVVTALTTSLFIGAMLFMYDQDKLGKELIQSYKNEIVEMNYDLYDVELFLKKRYFNLEDFIKSKSVRQKYKQWSYELIGEKHE